MGEEYDAEYRRTMTGIMEKITPDRLIAREWVNRLNTSGRDMYLNETTAGRLLQAARTRRLEGLLFASQAWPRKNADDLAYYMDPDHAADAVIAVTRKGWKPDPNRLIAADRDLGRLCDISPDTQTLIIPLRALVAWLAGDTQRTRVCLTAAVAASPALDTATVALMFACRHGIGPGGRDIPSDPLTGLPDPVAERAREPLPLEDSLRVANDVANMTSGWDAWDMRTDDK